MLISDQSSAKECVLSYQSSEHFSGDVTGPRRNRTWTRLLVDELHPNALDPRSARPFAHPADAKGALHRWKSVQLRRRRKTSRWAPGSGHTHKHTRQASQHDVGSWQWQARRSVSTPIHQVLVRSLTPHPYLVARILMHLRFSRIRIGDGALDLWLTALAASVIAAFEVRLWG